MNRKSGLMNIVIYFLGSLVYGIVVGIAVGIVVGVDKIETSFAFFAGTSLLVALVIMAYDWKFIKEQLRVNLYKKETYVYGVVGVMVALGISLLLPVIFQSIDPNINHVPENQALIDEMLKETPFILTVLIVAVVVPITEELVFRAGVMGLLLGDKVGKSYFPYIIGALIFTLMHDITILQDPTNIQNIYFFSIYLSISLVLAVVYKKSNHNLLAVIIMHMINNFIGLL